MEPLTAALGGAALGLTGGLAPGPLTALVMTQTLRHGTGEGVKVSLAPVITDGPLLLLGALAADWLARSAVVFAGIGLLGAGFLFFLGLESLRAGRCRLLRAAARTPQHRGAPPRLSRSRPTAPRTSGTGS